MKSFLKVLFSILALGLVASVPALRAQDPSTPPPEGGKGERKGGKGPRMMTVEGVEKAVGTLTAEQKTKIGDILSKAQADMKALSSEDRAKGREMMMTVRKDVRAVLTAEQQAKFDEMMPAGKGGKKKDN